MKIVEDYSNDSSKGLSIQSAHYIGDFAIRINFNDGTERLVNFKPFLKNTTHPEIKKYYQENMFKQFRIVDGNLDWNDFDMCFSLEDLYQNNILHKEQSPIS